MMNSLKKAISYSLMPHELGYCGPCDADNSKKKLKDYLIGGNISEMEVRKLLDEFTGAVTYYQLIAKKNNISDYYDEKVIEAYWLGNELLYNVAVDDIKKMVRTEFVGPGLLTREKAEEKISGFPKTGVAHHTFHIFFIGAVTNRVQLVGEAMDRCRPSWGEVKEILSAENKVKVKTTKLFPKEVDVEMEIFWDKAFVSELKIGDLVTSHWGRISEKITDKELANLKKYTMINYNEFIKHKVLCVCHSEPEW